jgi:hypothetical protein
MLIIIWFIILIQIRITIIKYVNYINHNPYLFITFNSESLYIYL